MNTSNFSMYKTALLAFVFFALLQPAHAATSRIALVIGNADYQSLEPLKSPVNDARAMYWVLKEDLNFKVIYAENANQWKMERALIKFKALLVSERQRGNETVGLFYYSGHGAQYGDENYLLPVAIDTAGNLETIFSSETIALSSVLDGMKEANATMNIVILDACRNNPFSKGGFKSGSKSVGKGLAWVDNTSSEDSMVPQGSFIAYATAPNRVAFDDGKAKYSPYTRNLLKYIRKRDMSIEKMFKLVRNAVIEETNNQQVPWESSSLKGEFFFAGKEKKETLRLRSGGFR
ncbi:MAG: caspase family protein [Pseudomonadota bacterium]